MKNNTITFTVRANNGENINGFYSRKTDKISLMLPNSGKLYEVHIIGASQPYPHRIYLLDGDEVTVNFNEGTVPATWHVLVDVGHELYQNVIGKGKRGGLFNRTPDTVFMDLARAYRKDLSTLVARVEDTELARPEWDFLTDAIQDNGNFAVTQPVIAGNTLVIPEHDGEVKSVWLYKLTDAYPRKYIVGDCGFILQVGVPYSDKHILLREAMKAALLNLTTAMVVSKNI